MTSTGFSLGFGDNTKPSSKVLRPPGGGSSDIFGSETPATPRSMRNHMASNIFGSTQDASVKNSGDNARRGVKNGDSHSRLFGEVNRPFTPAKNHMKSSIPLGGPDGVKVTNGNGTASSAPTPTNGHANGKNGKAENNNAVGDHQNGVSKTELEENPNFPSSEESKLAQNQEIAPNSQSDKNNDNNTHSTQSNEEKQSNNDKQPEPTDNESITAKSLDKTIASSQVSPINEMNGNNDDNSITKDVIDNNSSATSSSIVSPISGISLDSGDTNSKSSSVRSPRGGGNSRNPVTGMGIEMPSYKSRTRGLRRDGNPVTGEGYNKSSSSGLSGGAEINTTVPSLNGANQVINKNRIPPGGYSSGLW